MSTFRKTVTVSFYVVEPSLGPQATFQGVFPHDEVLDRIVELDLASGEFHVQDGLFHNEMFCTVHDGPVRLLGAYNKDLYATVATERKGEIREISLSDGEGIVDATYVAFFPDSVAAMLRTSVRSPGTARTANWLSLFGGHSCHFAAMAQIDAMSRLDRDPSDVRSVFFRAVRQKLPVIRGGSMKVAEALEAASHVSSSTRIGLTLGVAKQSEKATWWNGMRSILADMVEVLPEFETARVEIKGGKNVNLLDAYITARVDSEIDATRRIRPVDAAQAMTDAYVQVRSTLQASLLLRTAP